MAQFVNMFAVDLQKPTFPQPLRQMVAEGDAKGNRIGAIVTDDGAVVSLGGACVGKVVRADGATVTLTGTIDGNTAYVVLDQASCAVEGPISVAVCWVSGSDVTTLVVAYGTVVNTQTGNTIQPSTPIPDLAQLLAAISDMQTATAAANAAATNALGNFAPTFAEASANAAGTYVTYSDGKLYFLPGGHTANTTWANTTKIAVTTGGELVNLTDKLNDFSGLTEIQFSGTNQFIKTSGNIGSTVNLTPQGSTGYRYAIVSCSQGDKFTITAQGGQSPRTWCFVDSENVILSRDPTIDNTVTDLVLTAPANAAKLIINDKSGSRSYIGTDRITDVANDLAQTNSNLTLYTGGPFVEIPSGADLNDYHTIGRYYANGDIGGSISNKPYDAPYAFDLFVQSAYGDNTTYLIQIFRSRASERPIAMRRIRSDGTALGAWSVYAFDTLASAESDGLMYRWDQVKLNNVNNFRLFEQEMYPSLDGSISDLLTLEKLHCVFHDNYWRADNATEIGNNGSRTNKYLYSDMAPSSTESENIQVGISGHKAVATNPYSVASSVKRIKYKNVSRSVPYKVIMSFDGMGVLAISPIDTDNYLYVSATNNSFTVGGIGSLAIESVTVTHNLGLSTVVVYVYGDRINVYVAGVRLASVSVALENMLVGILFSAADINSIAYTNFDVFNSCDNLPAYQDEGIEQATAFSDEIVNSSSTADYSYGITLNTETVRHSMKSIRFEQRKADSGSIYRSEITVKNPRGKTEDDNYALQTKFFEFDFFLPSDYGLDTQPDLLWQMHHTPDGVVADGLVPNIAFNTQNGHFILDVRSFYFKAQSSSEITDAHSYDLGEYTAGRWYHMLVFIREGYLPEHNPCTAIWLDGELVHYDRSVNGYNTTNGSYLKMGMYKPSYVYSADTGTTKRVIYLDNVYVWM